RHRYGERPQAGEWKSRRTARSRRTQSGEPEDVDRTRSRAQVSEPAGDRGTGESTGDARRLERGAPERQLRGEHRRGGARRPVRRARRVALAGDAHDLTVAAGGEEQVRGTGAVTAREHDASRAEGKQAPDQPFGLFGFLGLVLLIGRGGPGGPCGSRSR